MTRSEQLAINGGPRSVSNPISPWPVASDGVKVAIQELIATNSWGLYDGPSIIDLQQALQEMFDCTHSMLCCSGTMAVELALRGVGVKPDAEVVLAGYDFPGNFRAIEATGAKPVLVDVVEDGWILDASQLWQAVCDKTAAVLVSHLHGQLIDMSALRAAIPDSVKIVEDCCQVPGASLNQRSCGSYGDVSVFSFGGSKLLSAGRGGAILSKDESVVRKAQLFGARGNEAFPLSQLQAAVLVPQIAELKKLNSTRQASVEWLVAELAKACPTQLIRPDIQSESAWYKLPWLLADGIDREVVLARLQAEGVPVDIGFRGFAKRTGRRCRKVGDLPNAIRAAKQTILLHHPALLEPTETREQIVSGFRKVMSSLDG